MATTLKLLATVAGTCLALGISGLGAAQANTLSSNTENSVKLSTQESTCSRTSKLLAVGEFTVCEVHVKKNGKWVFDHKCSSNSGSRCNYIYATGTLKLVNCRTYVPRVRTGNIPLSPQYTQKHIALRVQSLPTATTNLLNAK